MPRKLVESTFVTLDGVIDEPQKWSPPYWNDEHNSYASKLLEPAEALLLGRATYDVFASAWPQRSGDPYTDKMNSMPKFVASRTLRDASWNASIIQGDVPEFVAGLKSESGGDILKFGTGQLDRALLEHRLVDEYHFWMFPVIAGGGQRLLDDVELTHLDLADVARFDSGIVVLTYSPKPT
ncbi:MAG: dihydrofolate reductase family protein [bacterium]